MDGWCVVVTVVDGEGGVVVVAAGALVVGSGTREAP